jgi:hypothetical protein
VYEDIRGDIKKASFKILSEVFCLQLADFSTGCDAIVRKLDKLQQREQTPCIGV